MPAQKGARLLVRTIIVLLLYVPAAVVAAYPSLLPGLPTRVAGVPLSIWLGTLYLALFAVLTIVFAGQQAAAQQKG